MGQDDEDAMQEIYWVLRPFGPQDDGEAKK